MEASPPTSPAEVGKTKKVRDPNAPKRNASAYLIFSNATRNNVHDAFPNAAVADINKILAEKFRLLSSEERATWDKKAAADKERYSKEMAQYFPGPDVIHNKSLAADVAVAQTAVSRATVVESPLKSLETQASAKKRKTAVVSKASADLLAKFMKKKQKITPTQSQQDRSEG